MKCEIFEYKSDIVIERANTQNLMNELNETVKEIMRYNNEDEYTESELEDYFDTIKEYSVKKRINELKREMNETLDVNKKIELANKINKINKEVLEW